MCTMIKRMNVVLLRFTMSNSLSIKNFNMCIIYIYIYIYICHSVCVCDTNRMVEMFPQMAHNHLD